MIVKDITETKRYGISLDGVLKHVGTSDETSVDVMHKTLSAEYNIPIATIQSNDRLAWALEEGLYAEGFMFETLSDA